MDEINFVLTDDLEITPDLKNAIFSIRNQVDYEFPVFKV